MGSRGLAVSEERLGEIFLELKEKDAANINLVTGTHYVPQIMAALDCAQKQGLDIPVVYNSGGYEKTETLKLLEGYVDIYLPDFKYAGTGVGTEIFSCAGLCERAMAAIKEMVRQTGNASVWRGWIHRKGTIVRHLILPGHTGNSIKVLRYLT